MYFRTIEIEKCTILSCIASFLLPIYNKRVLRYKKLRTKYTEPVAYGSNLLREIKTQFECDKIAFETKCGYEFFLFLETKWKNPEF